MSSELVHISQNKPFTTSLVIAEAVGLSHRVVIRLIRKHKTDFDEFGFLNFESSESRGTQGAKTEFANLNEDQATYLITLFRNTDIVRKFKIQLVKAFRKAINDLDRLKNQKSDPSWKLVRDDTKLGFKWMAESLKEQRELCGKKTEAVHFMNEAKLVNGVYFGHVKGLDRDNLSKNDIKTIGDLQRLNALMISKGIGYKDRKEHLQRHITERLQLSIN